MISREFMEANYGEMQREAARLALIREARTAEKAPVEGAVGRRRRRCSGLPSFGAIMQATRGFVTQPN